MGVPPAGWPSRGANQIMNIPQNLTSTQNQPLPAQVQQLGGLGLTKIPLAKWDSYGFSIRASRIRSWIAKAKQNGIMREGAVTRIGQFYYATPARVDHWMDNHGETTPLTRGPVKRRRGEDKDTKRTTTDGQKQQAKRTLHRGNLNPGQPSLTDPQVEEIRRAAAQTPPEGRLKLYAELAAKFGRHTKVIEECAQGKTYKRLPLTATYTASQAQAPKQAGKRGKKSQTEGQAASAAAG
jgi:hypothetical protein